ncbi:MAG: DNA-binding domain-containing protein [Pseudomonadota bacterium]
MTRSTALPLAELQDAFMRAILDDDAALPQAWSARHAAGMSVYRGNYRSALMDALASSFEHTARYAGADAFRQASMHHVIQHPPSHWTIDAVGEGFDETCQELFRENAEVAELAWLEWTMLELAGAPDYSPLDAAQFAHASAGFGDQDWLDLRLEFAPRTAARLVSYDLEALWRALSNEDALPENPLLSDRAGCLVWREGERPTFLIVEQDNARAFAAMQEGATYGAVVERLAGAEPEASEVQIAAERAGGFLGHWLTNGLVSRVLSPA